MKRLTNNLVLDEIKYKLNELRNKKANSKPLLYAYYPSKNEGIQIISFKNVLGSIRIEKVFFLPYDKFFKIFDDNLTEKIFLITKSLKMFGVVDLSDVRGYAYERCSSFAFYKYIIVKKGENLNKIQSGCMCADTPSEGDYIEGLLKSYGYIHVDETEEKYKNKTDIKNLLYEPHIQR